MIIKRGGIVASNVEKPAGASVNNAASSRASPGAKHQRQNSDAKGTGILCRRPNRRKISTVCLRRSCFCHHHETWLNHGKAQYSGGMHGWLSLAGGRVLDRARRRRKATEMPINCLKAPIKCRRSLYVIIGVKRWARVCSANVHSLSSTVFFY